MLEELCAECKNYFLRDRYGDIHSGTYVVSDGTLALPFLAIGQYFRVVGSKFNDGIYQYPAVDLADETFNGAIWALSIPPSFIALASEIKAWNEKNASVLNSPYQSESFGGYNYSLKSGAGGGSYGWQSQFADKLRQYRRISVL